MQCENCPHGRVHWLWALTAAVVFIGVGAKALGKETAEPDSFEPAGFKDLIRPN